MLGLPLLSNFFLASKIFPSYYVFDALQGLAYVEYEKETDATQAVIKTDQSIIDGFTIKVFATVSIIRRLYLNVGYINEQSLVHLPFRFDSV